jgi:hypothetical protein
MANQIVNESTVEVIASLDPAFEYPACNYLASNVFEVLIARQDESKEVLLVMTHDVRLITNKRLLDELKQMATRRESYASPENINIIYIEDCNSGVSMPELEEN